MEQTWRWFGPSDPVSLLDIMQAGAKNVVTGLHHLPPGAVWTTIEIKKRQRQVREVKLGNSYIDTGLEWTVVESIPIHEDLKRRKGPNLGKLLYNFEKSLRNLNACGINTVCINFMPLLDWTRTNLSRIMPDQSKALEFNMVALAAFDIYDLERKKADYSTEMKKKANVFNANLRLKEIKLLKKTILAGLPGAAIGYDLDEFKRNLLTYQNIESEEHRENLIWFLQEMIPAANHYDIRLAIHPDDPPFPILGLPRAVSTEADLDYIFNKVPDASNGLCFCTGSLGARADNDVVKMAQKYAKRIHFAHLRNVTREENGSFYEANHLEGDVDMYGVVKALVLENKRRLENEAAPVMIPFRPDHGHQMLDDLEKTTNPGYSAIGRLRGLAELRGLELGIVRSLQ